MTGLCVTGCKQSEEKTEHEKTDGLTPNEFVPSLLNAQYYEHIHNIIWQRHINVMSRIQGKKLNDILHCLI